MKRHGRLFDKIVSRENLYLAHQNARKGKTKYREVQMVDEHLDDFISALRAMLINGVYRTSEYTRFTKKCGEKIREIFKLPYYPDRIVHHAILQVILDIFVKNLIADTYSCVPGRGIHTCANKIKRILKYENDAEFCLKIDIKKFYPSIDNEILKAKLRTKFKCLPTLDLLDNIIDSVEGLPIGNYLSQHLANFYLSEFDHWLKEEKKVKHYFRYSDDIVIIARTKRELHQLRKEIEDYLKVNLNLSIYRRWQVFPISKRGIDFLGFRFFKGYTLLRKRIVRNFKKVIKLIKKNKLTPHQGYSSIVSYYGWLIHANTYRLRQKYFDLILLTKIYNYSLDLGFNPPAALFN